MERRYEKIIGEEVFHKKKRNGNSKTNACVPQRDITRQKMPQDVRRFSRDNAAAVFQHTTVIYHSNERTEGENADFSGVNLVCNLFFYIFATIIFRDQKQPITRNNE